MRPTRRAAGVLLVALSLHALPAHGAPAVEAKGSWSMVPMSKDTNGDGFIDGDGGVPTRGALSADPARTYQGANNFVAQPHERLIDGILSWHLDAQGYPVRLNACASTGANYSWRITQGDQTVLTTPSAPLTKKKCKTTVTLPEGTYTFTLTVRDGRASDTVELRAQPRNILWVALGDSYASGEGNPRNVEAFLKTGSIGFRPYWDSDACNRSVHGAPAQAALALENQSAKTSVTLVHAACSGATIDNGVLGPLRSAGQSTSQLEQVRNVIGDRDIDVMTLSIGGNDVGFTDILGACLITENCPTSRASFGRLRTYPTLQDGVQDQTSELARGYSQINDCLQGKPCTLANGQRFAGLRLAESATVSPTLYPDITRSRSGEPCTYLTLTRYDFTWARDTILTPSAPNPYAYTLTSGATAPLSTAAGTLNGSINATSRLQWTPIVGTWGASGESSIGRGVCAGSDAWVFGVTGLAGFTSGSFHPNVAGLQAAARQIVAAVSQNLASSRS